MDKFIGQNIEDAKQRELYIKNNADGAEEKFYTRVLTAPELQEVKEKLTNISIEIQGLETEKSMATRAFNAQLKDLKEKLIIAIGEVRSKTIVERNICYKYIDRENRVTGYYTQNGELIEERPCTAEELQGTVFEVLRKTV